MKKNQDADEHWFFVLSVSCFLELILAGLLSVMYQLQKDSLSHIGRNQDKGTGIQLPK